MKRKKIKLLVIAILLVILPVTFEIVDAITGVWFNDDGIIPKKKYYAIGIIIIYLVVVVYNVVTEFKEKNCVELLEKDNNILRRTLYKISDYMSYSNKGISKQSKYLAENTDVTIRELEIQGFATYICSGIYDILTKLYGKEYITVNVYHKYKRDNNMYSKMIAHEGKITQPRYFGVEKMLKKSKSNYKCERILLDENPSYNVLLEPREVANAFRKNVDNSMYRQYVALPIIDNESKCRFLIEINVLKECVLGKNKDDVINMINMYISPFIEYFLLMMEMEKYAETVKNTLGEGGNTDE